MLQKENLAALSLVWFLVSLMVGYAIGGYLMPAQTVETAGFLGFSTSEVPFFNWRAFLFGFSIVQLVMPGLHLFRKEWGWAVVEFGLILGGGILCWQLAGEVFTGAVTDSAPLGFNKVVTLSFRTEFLLLTLAVIWGLYSCLRFMVGRRIVSGRWVDSPGLRLALLMLAWVATACYFIGIHTPVFHSVKFWVFEDEVSLVQSIEAFFVSGEIFIGVIVLTFTLVFPMIKLAYMFWMILSVPTRWSLRVNKVLAILGKYSMLDVFVLALLLLNLKFDSNLLDMTLESGVIWFTVSILLNMGVTSFLVLRQVEGKDA
ncbi:MAG TPA: hypothetical protein ENJ82_18050 [Bacteroidetes bacterium]|nr:hypothetical protein [Bacteroidota bacterium]